MMLILSRILIGLLLIPVMIVLLQGIIISSLHLLAFKFNGGSAAVAILGLCCYLGLIGFIGLLRVTYKRDLSQISKRFSYITGISGGLSLLISNYSNYIFGFNIDFFRFSILIILLALYQLRRWEYANKIKQADSAS